MQSIKRLLVLLAVLSGFIITTSLSAQDDSSTRIQEMLAFLPDTPEIRSGHIGYANYHAVFPIMAEYSDIADVDSLLACLRAEECDDMVYWFDAMPALSAELIQLRALIQGRNYADGDCERDPATFAVDCGEPPVYDSMLDVMGFGYFDIMHTLSVRSFDMLPVFVLAGQFDTEAIDVALTARGYAAQDAPDDINLWCVVEGCDESVGGRATIDTANIFGGDVGAKRPLAATSDYVVSSAVIETVKQALSSYMGDVPSLADAPEIIALDSALNSISGTPVQAVIIPSPTTLVFGIDALIAQMAASGVEITDELIEELTEDYMLSEDELVPIYEAMAIADYKDDTGRQTVVALVFNNEDTAILAETRIQARLANYVSLEWQVPMDALIEGRGDITDTQFFTDEVTGKTVLMLQWWMTAPDDPDSQNTYMQGGLFPILLRGIYAGDMGWLATILTS